MREGLHKVVSAEDTIVAIASPFGRSALGIVRLSGPAAISITYRLFSSANRLNRTAVVGQWRDVSGDVVDDVIVTVFHAPRSYTGEDVVEITGHGNPLTLNRIVGSIQASGARAATPGGSSCCTVSSASSARASSSGPACEGSRSCRLERK